MDILKQYVDIFNRDDEECYRNDIDNAHVYEWMKNEVPIFECPDKDIERAYYFRYWTYRKHIKSTEDGVVITEFLPKVGWSGKHNTIVAAFGHHLYEGRWLRNAEKYLKSYIDFFLTVSDRRHGYSTWLIYAIYQYALIRGDFDFGPDFLEKLDAYYMEWEENRGMPDGSYFSFDDHDAMEYMVSGTDENLQMRPGVRPTLNSYMCANAYAIAQFAKHYGDKELEEKYQRKHEHLKRFINENLYEDGFFRAYHFTREEEALEAVKWKGISPREQIGFIPFMFDIPDSGREACFDLLLDENGFYTPYGLTTLEKTNPRFLFKADHECLWNGYIWPFATSQTLTGLYRVAHASGKQAHQEMFCTLLSQYARMHYRKTEDGRLVSWIDEVMDPIHGDWSSRTLLRDWGWREDKGGYERGKDYNHSTFCDLVISGLIGVSVKDGDICVEPLAPKDWTYFCLTGVKLLGKEYDIFYDATGEKYGKGIGLRVIETT